VILVDTSAWIEFVRATGSRAHLAVRTAVEQNLELGVPDVVRMELLAGARDDSQVASLQSLLARFTHVPASSPHDHDVAASLNRSSRLAGRTVRSHIDCLVAAMAVRLDVPLIAKDKDFTMLSTVSTLRLA
jgi:predicted nucleic acid-binding protein